MTAPNSPRIAIVTFPFHGNYGGMLQAYAMQEVLTRLGYSPQLAEANESSILASADADKQERQCRMGRLFRRFGLRMKGRHLRAFMYFMVRSFTSRFVHLQHLSAAAGEWARYFAETDACVVGSDQVWRNAYTRGNGELSFYFLKHAPADVRARSISYAASFGTDEWEGTPEQTEECAALLREFRAVSVREHSGTDICREALGRADAQQMPDPTLLAESGDYARLIAADVPHADPVPARAYVVNYILDSTRGKRRLIDAAAHAAGLKETRTLCYSRRGRADGSLHPYAVGEWLHAIRHAGLMVTDSFHGCVFSVIFNTPFICIPNGKRGTSRFESLLGTFGLENRILSADASPADIARLAATPIDWETVNARHAAERERGLRFLQENLPRVGAC